MEILKKTILLALTTGMTRGYWNATTNTPNIMISSECGDMWYVSISGNTSLGGIDNWNVGDWATRYNIGWGKVIIDGYNYTGSTCSVLIIPDFSVNYYTKIGLKQSARDIGFFDAFIESNENNIII
jgi:hypothetical protein